MLKLYFHRNHIVIGEMKVSKKIGVCDLAPNVIVTIIDDYEEGKKFNMNELLKVEYSVPLLKSNLQKAIRRQLVETAILTAKQLILQNQSIELLRRIPIIIVEDVCSQSFIYEIIWLMLATSKGYILNQSDVHFIERVVATLCQCPEYDSSPRLNHNRNEDVKMIKNQIANLLEEILTIENEMIQRVAISHIVRFCFGGTDGDMLMMLQAAKLCLSTGKLNQKNYYFNLIPNYDSVVDKKFSKDHQLNEAADFHCTDIIIQLKKKMKSPLSYKDIKDHMWTYHSSINFRHPKKEPEQNGKKYEHYLSLIPSLATTYWIGEKKDDRKRKTLHDFFNNNNNSKKIEEK